MEVPPPARPAKTLAAYKYSNRSANKTVNQNMKYGTANTQKAHFLPSNLMTTKNKKVPKNPPRYDIDPSHDASGVVIGPADKGVFSDNKTRSEGDSQPISPPYEIAHIFAHVTAIN